MQSYTRNGQFQMGQYVVFFGQPLFLCRDASIFPTSYVFQSCLQFSSSQLILRGFYICFRVIHGNLWFGSVFFFVQNSRQSGRWFVVFINQREVYFVATNVSTFDHPLIIYFIVNYKRHFLERLVLMLIGGSICYLFEF